VERNHHRPTTSAGRKFAPMLWKMIRRVHIVPKAVKVIVTSVPFKLTSIFSKGANFARAEHVAQNKPRLGFIAGRTTKGGFKWLRLIVRFVTKDEQFRRIVRVSPQSTHVPIVEKFMYRSLGGRKPCALNWL